MAIKTFLRKKISPKLLFVSRGCTWTWGQIGECHSSQVDIFITTLGEKVIRKKKRQKERVGKSLEKIWGHTFSHQRTPAPRIVWNEKMLMSSLEPGFDMILGKSFQLYLFLLVYYQEDVSFYYENCRCKKYYLLFSIAEPIQETSEVIPALSQLEFLIPEIFLCDQLRLREHPRRMLLGCFFSCRWHDPLCCLLALGVSANINMQATFPFLSRLPFLSAPFLLCLIQLNLLTCFIY